MKEHQHELKSLKRQLKKPLKEIEQLRDILNQQKNWKINSIEKGEVKCPSHC